MDFGRVQIAPVSPAVSVIQAREDVIVFGKPVGAERNNDCRDEFICGIQLTQRRHEPVEGDGDGRQKRVDVGGSKANVCHSGMATD